MYIRLLLVASLRTLLPLAILTTTYLYLYPVFHGCAFPSVDGSTFSSFRNTFKQHVSESADGLPNTLAPFRLLVLADPQLEGDSSLPDPECALPQRLRSHWNRVTAANTTDFRDTLAEVFQECVTQDIPRSVLALRKRIDLFGNDYYLAHIFRTLHWWTKPTHVTVLGDLIGSQWVTDEEFEWRGWRYWNRVFAKGTRIPDDVMYLKEEDKEKSISANDDQWKNRIINIAGNHDIGYAGDISRGRMDRFERVFGKANWDVRFEYNQKTQASTEAVSNKMPSIHMVILNSLNLDTPALSREIQGETYGFLNSVITRRIRAVEDNTTFLLLLTHLPLHKRDGICVDGPFFGFWDDNDDGGGLYRPGGLKEQNHLSQHASQSGTLESLFGMSGNLDVPAQGRGRNGLILTGHDHEGCDVLHYIPSNSTGHWNDEPERVEGDDEMSPSPSPKKTTWEARRWRSASSMNHRGLGSSHTGVREITLRSMMGEFGGNAGLLSLWYDFDASKWDYAFQSCQLGVQHIWWAIHVLDLVTCLLLILTFVFSWSRSPLESRQLDVSTTKAPASKRTPILGKKSNDSTEREDSTPAVLQKQKKNKDITNRRPPK